MYEIRVSAYRKELELFWNHYGYIVVKIVVSESRKQCCFYLVKFHNFVQFLSLKVAHKYKMGLTSSIYESDDQSVVLRQLRQFFAVRMNTFDELITIGQFIADDIGEQILDCFCLTE